MRLKGHGNIFAHSRSQPKIRKKHPVIAVMSCFYMFLLPWELHPVHSSEANPSHPLTTILALQDRAQEVLFCRS